MNAPEHGSEAMIVFASPKATPPAPAVVDLLLADATAATQ
jgi:hypothetical protein